MEDYNNPSTVTSSTKPAIKLQVLLFGKDQNIVLDLWKITKKQSDSFVGFVFAEASWLGSTELIL